MTKDKRVDLYISKSADFAKPILTHLRELVHSISPDVNETIKWGFPIFEYHKAVLCSMAAFKQHCALGFWKASLMNDPNKLFLAPTDTSMGHLGKITKLSDLPSDKILIAYLKEAAVLNEKGIKVKRKKQNTNDKQLQVPDYLKKLLSKNKKALDVFTNFSYTNKKEYIDWLSEAKTEETRTKRLETAMGWISEGKIKNWKYARK